jgi:hypothetical protein
LSGLDPYWQKSRRSISQWYEAEADQCCNDTGRYRLLLRWAETIPFSCTDDVHCYHSGYADEAKNCQADPDHPFGDQSCASSLELSPIIP